MIDLGVLILRVITGMLMVMLHGWGKILGVVGFLSGKEWKFVNVVSSLGFPVPGLFAILAGVVEFFSSILVILGILTRVNAGLLSFVMLVAVYYNTKTGASYELALIYFVIFLCLILIGGGKYSLDRYFLKKKV
ncbi:MAG: DoxX family protein [Brevinematia bacterium]